MKRVPRILFSIGSFNIYYYSIFILSAILIAIFFGNREFNRLGYPKGFVMDIIIEVILSAIIGARLYYVLFNLEYYISNPLDILMIWNGGLAIYGGIIGGVASLFYQCKKRGVSFLKTLDVLAPFLILGQAIGRWGNFFNGEAYGKITSLESLRSLHIPEFIIRGMYINGVYYEPTFLYESLWCLLGFVILLLIRKFYKCKKIGFMTGVYFIIYPMGRFFIEAHRSDSLYIGPYRVSMLLSVVLIILGIVLIVTSRKRGRYCEEV